MECDGWERGLADALVSIYMGIGPYLNGRAIPHWVGASQRTIPRAGPPKTGTSTSTSSTIAACAALAHAYVADVPCCDLPGRCVSAYSECATRKILCQITKTLRPFYVGDCAASMEHVGK